MPDEIQGFPTIKLFPAGSKGSPVVYSGSRTIEDLAAFIKENGKYHADAYEGKSSNETEDEESDTVAGAQAVVGEAAAAATEKGESATKEAKEKGASATEEVKEKGATATEEAKEKGESASEGVKATVKSKVVEAAEAVKTVVGDSDDAHDEHDEL